MFSLHTHPIEEYWLAARNTCTIKIGLEEFRQSEYHKQICSQFMFTIILPHLEKSQMTLFISNS